MCMSEWTSMPAAWGWSTVIAGAASRGGRGFDPVVVVVGFFLRGLMMSTTLGGREKESTRNARGTWNLQFPQRDQHGPSAVCESPMTGSPPRGPGYMTGTKHQCRLGHRTASTTSG
jgi:hypothetical protein